MMKTLKVLIAPLWISAFAAVACMKKEVEELPHPQMQYTNLNNVEVMANSHYTIDLDGNGHEDITFKTKLVGDPILKRDRRQFLVESKIAANLLVNQANESPKLIKGEKVGLQHDNYNWYEVSSVVLAEKVIPLHGEVSWQGDWKNANHNFVPVQIEKEGKLFHGWIDISFDRNGEQIILHRAAISTQDNVSVKTGF